MAKNRKNIIIRIQDWIESVPGQTFLNYAYSWGAAVGFLGALFILTHIPGAFAMLFFGMGRFWCFSSPVSTVRQN